MSLSRGAVFDLIWLTCGRGFPWKPDTRSVPSLTVASPSLDLSKGCKYTCHTACRDRVSLDCHALASPVGQDHLNNNHAAHVSTHGSGSSPHGHKAGLLSISTAAWPGGLKPVSKIPQQVVKSAIKQLEKQYLNDYSYFCCSSLGSDISG